MIYYIHLPSDNRNGEWANSDLFGSYNILILQRWLGNLPKQYIIIIIMCTVQLTFDSNAVDDDDCVV